MNKSKGLTFILSLLPGLGHFYLGLMNRGLQFMIIFFGAISFADVMIFFGFAIPIIWFYSLFDALQQHKQMEETKELLDSPIIQWGVIQDKKLLFGWGFIILGTVYLLEKVTRYYFDWQIYEISKNVLIGAILVIIGIRLVTGKNIIPTSKPTETHEPEGKVENE
ncbi:hypothetical protein ACFSCX_10850 [Bacillus salitolerans]|uniref:TM2 domain-containing protein n=1 Tax=Bacillus salitolerans TaxID=1437434 RepID=A0ABW4LQJ2_9BACI